MSFPWWESKIPEDYRATFSQKLATMIVDETKRRAQILFSLGYSLDEAQRRVVAYIRWDYQTGVMPSAAKKLETVVAETYGRRAVKPTAEPAAVQASREPTSPRALEALQAALSPKRSAEKSQKKSAEKSTEKPIEKSLRKSEKKKGKKR